MSDVPPDDEIMAAAGVPAHRRLQDIPASDISLILYQLSEMKAQVREGFAKMEGRFEKIDARYDALADRVVALENFRTRSQERDEVAARSANTINSRWVPILLWAAGVAVTFILLYAAKL